MRKTNNIGFCGIKPFNISASYTEIDITSPENEFNSHVHSECEIYVNLTGDVSFMVENTLYPVKSGDVIIARPFEYHHCIYHSDKPHNHFWILFSSAGNEDILPAFFDRDIGEKNLISLPDALSKEIIKICSDLVDNEDSLKNQIDFLRLIHILNNNEHTHPAPRKLPHDVQSAIDFINENLSNSITVNELSRISNVSINTLERHFKNELDLSPCAYIQSRRLSSAAALLKTGKNVSEVCRECGFPDYSHFISLFKKRYGKTPLQYKKELLYASGKSSPV